MSRCRARWCSSSGKSRNCPPKANSYSLNGLSQWFSGFVPQKPIALAGFVVTAFSGLVRLKCTLRPRKIFLANYWIPSSCSALSTTSRNTAFFDYPPKEDFTQKTKTRAGKKPNAGKSSVVDSRHYVHRAGHRRTMDTAKVRKRSCRTESELKRLSRVQRA
jgi:hypothetical protein